MKDYLHARLIHSGDVSALEGPRSMQEAQSGEAKGCHQSWLGCKQPYPLSAHASTSWLCALA
jgi:hypothetical protein